MSSRQHRAVPICVLGAVLVGVGLILVNLWTLSQQELRNLDFEELGTISETVIHDNGKVSVCTTAPVVVVTSLSSTYMNAAIDKLRDVKGVVPVDVGLQVSLFRLLGSTWKNRNNPGTMPDTFSNELPGQTLKHIVHLVDFLVAPLKDLPGDTKPVLLIQHALLILPVLRQMLPNMHLVLLVQDIVSSVMEHDFMQSLSMDMIEHLDVEHRIDQICLTRLRVTGDDQPPFPQRIPFSTPLPETAAANSPQSFPPCSIRDIPYLRASLVWSIVHRDVLRQLQGTQHTVLRDDLLPSALQQLTELVSDHLASTTAPRNELVVPDGKHADRYIYRRLIQEVFSLVDESVARHLGLSLSMDGFVYLPQKHQRVRVSDIPDQPFASPPQANSCWQDDASGPRPLCLPGFLVIGAQKASTSEVALWLRRNSQMLPMVGGKEIHFFDCVGRGHGRTRRSCGNARSDIPVSVSTKKNQPVSEFNWKDVADGSAWVTDVWAQYGKLGEAAHRDRPSDDVVLFEKSASYLDLAHPMDVMRLTPLAKIIVILRHPAERLYSGYWHLCNVEKTCSLEQFTGLFNDMLAGKAVPSEFLRSVDVGKYAKHIHRWRKAFPDKQIVVTFSKHFYQTPLQVMYEIENFVHQGRENMKHFQYKAKKTKSGAWELKTMASSGRQKIHTSHSAEFRKSAVYSAVCEFYKPWNKQLRALLEDAPIVLGRRVPADDSALRSREPETWSEWPEWVS